MPHRPLFLATVFVVVACSSDGGQPAAQDGAGGAPSSAGAGGSAKGGGGGSKGGGGQPGNGGSAGSDMPMAGAGGEPPSDAEAPGQGGSAGSAPDDGGAGAPDATGGPASPICPPGPFETPKPGPSESICPGFAVKYDWNEGPTWVPSQKAFFFSNFVMRAPGPGDMIKYDPATNKCEFFITGNGCNGLTPGPDGNSILATCQTPRALLKYDLTTKQSTVLVDMVEGHKLDSPNDLALHSNGTIYFSNTNFELGGRPAGGLGSALMRVDPTGAITVIGKGFINPLGLSPDQKRLYAMGGYWDLDDQGVPLKKNGGFTLGNDGIAIDCAGNVYTNSGAIMSPQNQRVASYAGGTNQAFGGEDRKILLVVGGKNMHIHRMNLPGLP